MAVSQEQFDGDLAGLVTSVGALITAVEAALANIPAADFTAEDTSVQAAAAQVTDELAKLNPATP